MIAVRQRISILCVVSWRHWNSKQHHNQYQRDDRPCEKVSIFHVPLDLALPPPQQAQEMAAVSDGAIVGSAIVNPIAQNGKRLH